MSAVKKPTDGTAKRLSRTERLMLSKKQAQSPGKPGNAARQKSGAPEHSATHNQIAVEKRTGRPSGFTEELGKEICNRIAGGAHLSKLVEEGVVPSTSAFARWTRGDTEESERFRAAVARAQEDRAELWADQLIEIADTDEDANRARVRIDARWKVIGSLLYRRYGVKQSIDINQNVNVAVAHADALIRLANQAKQIETDYKDITPQ